jgi:large subunit ribosomal protein L17
MRHAVAGYKLSRDSQHRRAMFRNLAAGVFQHGQITTTLPKAKAVQPFVEKLITLAKRGDLAARRHAIALLQDRDLATVDKQTGDPIFEEKSLIQKLFEDIGPRYSDRTGGYTRIIRLAQHRIGDGGELCVLQLVGEEEGPSVRGRFSRRRQKQDKRTAFAAKLRKDRSSSPKAKATEEETPAEAPAEQASEEESK